MVADWLRLDLDGRVPDETRAKIKGKRRQDKGSEHPLMPITCLYDKVNDV